LAIWNSSATASVIGKTVLDPSMLMVPERLAGASEAVPVLADGSVLGAALAPVDGSLLGAVLEAVLEASLEPVLGALDAPPPVLHALMAKTAVRASAPRRVGLVIVTRWSS